ncbi:NupC/NupG family nucleoside CNT transporter [Eisenibacter elegans]|jgi:CNT family concentrative nucleoside transporter|uniref:NupC/NupG family nucleoside CNT transporter n=1 Tax=Eisenibacter elegans TaxID=997 RepID=UPI0003FA9974|nr:nucleoside transporter C-terminal domain-containing protein [Eisenibacter elegans]
MHTLTLLRSVAGIFVMIGIAYLLSNNKRAINWRLVIVGILLQVLFGFLILRVDWVAAGFKQASEVFVSFLNFSLIGAEFLFGDLARNSNAQTGVNHSLGLIVAFQVLPTIIFFSTVSAALYYFGILQRIVYGIAWVMSKTMRLSGAESLSAAGNIFMGQTEAPLLVKPFIGTMTRSELMSLMTGGMATIAGGVLAAYVSFLGGADFAEQSRFAAHLLSASIMSAPAAIVMAKIIIPESEPELVRNDLTVSKENLGVNLLDAMSTGAADGLRLALNVGGMLLAFIAVIALLNAILSWIGGVVGINPLIEAYTQGVFKGLSLEYILGQIGRPLAYLMGIDWNETLLVGSLIGQKTAINEFVAYLDLGRLKAEGLLSEKSILIATYALCGFSNFSSIAIQIGGIGGMAPERPDLQATLSQLGIRALVAASLACFMTATIAGMIAH